ncbi:unnamed protein product [Paramecium pentaurelia]|uniref:Tr-type G domain-containing protein n=1 Tax=Paramecium pentaurelia TaxID=43138 RepID=A0A8S1S3Y2_9CILI|nr:unnamed protein product [Paramecium pentaurelia]
MKKQAKSKSPDQHIEQIMKNKQQKLEEDEYQALELTRMTSLNKINTDGQNFYINILHGNQEMPINLSQYLHEQYALTHSFKNYPPEQYYGNCEYKLKIIKVDQCKMEHRTTQMQFRLDEGKGIAYYRVGVEDDGTPTGINLNEMLVSIQWLIKFANNNKAEIILQKMHQGRTNQQKIAEFMVRRRLQDSIKTDIRVVMLGQVNSGKSSLIGMITTGKSNIGRQQFGKLFRQVVGFDSKGKVVNKINLLGQEKEDEYVFENATKIITFIDLLERQHYNNNEAMQNIQSQFPNYFMLVINAIQQLGTDFIKQLKLTLSQQIPIFIVVTHADKLKDDYELEILLFNIRQKLKQHIIKTIPIILVRSTEDVMLFSKQIIDQYEKETVIPVFILSNLEYKTHNLFLQFLNQLPLRNEFTNNNTQPVEFGIHQTFEIALIKQINDEQPSIESESFTVEDSILKSNKGIIQVQDRKLLILGGTVTKGIIKKGQSLLIGPDKQGNFYPVQVQNLQSNRVKVKSALSGQLCTVQFQLINSYKKNFGTSENPIRRGMVLVDAKLKPNSYTIFIVNLQFFAAGWKQFQQQQQQQELISINQTQQCNYINEKICLSQSHELLVHTPYSKQICLILENHCENQYLLVKQPSLTRKPSKSVEGKVVSSSQKYIEKSKSKKIKIQQKINVFEIKSGETLSLKLRFKYQSEYLTQGMKIVIMEQKFSAFGHVVSMEI